ncbi:hypothetical protein PIB30_092305 [Stylosanthes scabra]|uniref:Uncharacterized protein n=1 Tax=Stylosanthes scabra TaxID=79078 RepID=A0ABU6SV75_9FABA|nr:hypothetical protein [Stylosanthes scabra]
MLQFLAALDTILLLVSYFVERALDGFPPIKGSFNVTSLTSFLFNVEVELVGEDSAIHLGNASAAGHSPQTLFYPCHSEFQHDHKHFLTWFKHSPLDFLVMPPLGLFLVDFGIVVGFMSEFF